MGGGKTRHEDESLDNAFEASRYLASLDILDLFASASSSEVEALFCKLAFRP